MNRHVNQQLEAVVRNHLDELRAFIRKRVRDQDMVDDILQESLCKATRSIGSLKDEDNLLPWLYTIIRNSIYNVYRQKKYDQSKIQKMAAVLDEISEETKEELCTCYQTLMPSLSGDYGYLISEIDLKEHDRDEVARALNITVENLNVRLHRARKQLKDKLLLTCKQCAENGCFDCDCDL
jgi:RNA polymerase sigma-70 factor (ECF subfamily)